VIAPETILPNDGTKYLHALLGEWSSRIIIGLALVAWAATMLGLVWQMLRPPPAEEN
jgi:hypothetical protein